MKSSDLRIVGFSQITDYVLSFVITYFILLNFQPEFYGIWSHFIKFAGLAIVLFSFELNSSLVNKFTGIDIERRKSLISFYFFFNLIIFLPIVIIIFFFNDFLSNIIFNNNEPNNIFLFSIIFLYIVSNCLFQITEAFYLTEFKFKLVSFIIVFKQIIKIISLSIAIISNLDIYTAIFIYCIFDFILLSIFIIYSLGKYSLNIFKTRINQDFKNLILFARYIFFASVLVSIFLFVDNLFIIKNLSINQLANYSLYTSISAAMLIITNITNKIITPHISKSHNELSILKSRYFLSENLNFSIYILIPICFGLFLLSEDVIGLISSDKISIQSNIFLNMILFYFLFSITIIYRQYFSSINKPEFFLNVLFFGVIINCVCLFILKPENLITLFMIKNIILLSFILIFLSKTRINIKIIYNHLFSIASSATFFLIIILFFKFFSVDNRIIKILLTIFIGFMCFTFLDLMKKKPLLIRYFLGRQYGYLNLISISKNIYLRILKKISYSYFNERQIAKFNNLINIDDYIKNEYQEYRIRISEIISSVNPNCIIDYGCATGIQMIHLKKIYKKNISTKIYFIDLIIDYYKDYIINLIKHNDVSIDAFFGQNLYTVRHQVEAINCDAVLTYLNDKELDITLDYFFKLNPKIIIIHDFNFHNYFEKIISYISSEKSTRNLENILTNKLKKKNYKIEKYKSSKKEFYYKKYGYLYVLMRND